MGNKRNKLLKQNLRRNGQSQPPIQIEEGTFDWVYGYFSTMNEVPKFKILYENLGIEKDIDRLEMCFLDIVGELRKLKEGEDSDIDIIVKNCKDENLFNRYTIIDSGNDTSLGIYDAALDKKIDSYKLCKIDLGSNIKLQLEEEVKPVKLDKPITVPNLIKGKESKICYFNNDIYYDLNFALKNILEVDNYFDFGNLSIFSLRQTSMDPEGDKIFKKIFGKLEEGCYKKMFNL